MFEIMEVNTELLEPISSFYPTLCKLFPELDFVSYVVKVGDKFAYLFKQHEKGIFFLPGSSSYIRFTLDEKGILDTIFYENWEIDYEKNCIKKGDMEYSIEIDEVKDVEAEYNGEVIYSQENVSTEEYCYISYNHMYYKDYAISPIYPYHTKEKMKVTFIHGKKQEEYVRRELTLPYDTDFDTTSEKIIKYFKKYSILGFPLFHNSKTPDEMDHLILSKGFLNSIPELLFDVYNENNPLLKLLSEVVLEVKEIDIKRNDTKRSRFSIKQD